MNLENNKLNRNLYFSEAVFKHLSEYINVERVLIKKLEFNKAVFERNFIIKELYETQILIKVLEKMISRKYSGISFSKLFGKNYKWFYNILNGRNAITNDDIYLFNKFIYNKVPGM